ncbi:MAG TPA: hypothetical protein V6C58_03990 [Allocoleopsis sp.]
MDVTEIKQKISQVENKREFLVRLLEQPNLGSLRTDVNQALDELDDLIDDLNRTFNSNQ